MCTRQPRSQTTHTRAHVTRIARIDDNGARAYALCLLSLRRHNRHKPYTNPLAAGCYWTRKATRVLFYVCTCVRVCTSVKAFTVVAAYVAEDRGHASKHIKCACYAFSMRVFIKCNITIKGCIWFIIMIEWLCFGCVCLCADNQTLTANITLAWHSNP